MGTAQGLSIAPDVLDQAIAWSVRLHAGGSVDDSVNKALTEWRLKSVQHEHAWQAIQSAERNLLGACGQSPRLLIGTLQTAEQELRVRRRQILKMLGFGGVAVGTGWLVSAEAGRRGWHADYATASGERSRVQLADGTVLHLNTATAVDVRFDTFERRIVLRRGEVLIETGKDAAISGNRRRFWVETAEGQLEAIGTRFLVRQEDRATRLQVQDGVVAMYRDNAVRQMVRAGEAYVMQSDGVIRPVADAGFDHAAWVDGVLMAKQMRLADFVVELSRYRSGWLRCDPAVAELRVSGVFQLQGKDPSGRVLDALSASLPISVETRARYWTTLRPLNLSS
jgi:transmembrane sensor